MRKFLKGALTRLRKKEGSITLPALIIAGAIFVAGLFFMVEMPLKLIMANEMVDTVNNAAASGVTKIAEERIRYGELKIDESRAREAVHDVLKRTYNLDHNLNPLDQEGRENKVSSINMVDVQVVSKPLGASDTWFEIFTIPQTEEQIAEAKKKAVREGKKYEPPTVKVKDSSVFVYVDMTFKRPIRAGDDQLSLQRYAISEVSFPDYE